jgi:hypothetical protein
MVTTGSPFLPPEEIPARFADEAAKIIKWHNDNGRNVVVRPPAPKQIEAAKTVRSVEALARSLVRAV